MKMERRRLLGTGLAATAGAAALPLAGPALAQGRTTLTLMADRPEDAAELAARVAAASGGRLALEVTPVPMTARPEMLARTGEGATDMYMGSEEAFVATDPGFGLMAAMPGGMSPSELEGWIAAGDGQLLWDELSAEHGVKAFLAGDDGPQAIWSRAPLGGLSDLTGGTVGSTGLGLAALREMGADAVDIHAAGTDASDLVAIEGLSPVEMVETGLIDAFPHMATPNAGRPMSARSVGVNLARWDGLTEADRTLLGRAIAAQHGLSRARTLHRASAALRARGDAAEARAMPAEIWDAQIAASNAVMGSLLDADALRADLADAYLYFLADVAGWSEIGEAAFFLGRNRALTVSL